MDVLFANARLLDPVAGDADMGVLRAGGIRYMYSGYSKIYAMTLASFPIYDSRVALEGAGGPGRPGRTLARRLDGVGVAVGAFHGGLPEIRAGGPGTIASDCRPAV
jgi:hypothetical protein